MAKNKVDMNKNFENLKAQMMKKRELAENTKKNIEKECVSEPIADINISDNLNINTISDNNEYISNDETEYVNTNISNDENSFVNTGVDNNVIRNSNDPGEISDISNIIANEQNYEMENVLDKSNSIFNNNFHEENVYSNEYVARKTGMVSDININRIVIKKIEKQEQPKRITYYLRPETIKKIDKFSKLSGMGKSEFVQKILDEVLNNLEIER